MNVLVVEDIPETRELLRAQMAYFGYAVTTCPDAESALESYRKNFYALVLLDLGLPGMDGLELCRRIRSLPLGTMSMILVITGQAQIHVLEAALEAGADDYLVKPVSSDTLKIRVKIIEQRYKHRRQRHQILEGHTRTETALRTSKANLRALLDSCRQSLMLLDRDFTIQALNQTARKDAIDVYGCKISEGMQIDPSMFYDDAENVNSCFQQALDGKFVSLEQKVRGKNRQPYWFLFHYNPVKTANGQIIGVCLSVSDMTQRKRLEMNLQETKEAAEGANKAKSEFLSNISHELRTPLNIILGYTQILENTPLAKKELYAVKTIQRSGKHLLNLVDDLLDFSRFDLQKVQLTLTNVDLSAFLADIISRSRQEAQQKNLCFHYEQMSDLPEGISADEHRLRQILENLLDNAMKFTREGTITFRVGKISRPPEAPILKTVQGEPLSTTVSDDYHLIRFQIEDTGIGIRQGQWNRVFLPFYQLPHRWIPKAGTGLGLSISRKIAQMMHGDLFVESMEGRGSIFWCDVKLPPAKGRIQSLTISDPEYLIGFSGPSKTVLIVDDEEYSRKKLQEMLVPLGFNVIEAGSGHDALQCAEQFPPDVIIMDLVMPEMDGFEAMRRLRQNPKLAHVPLLAISAGAFDKTREESFLAGCDDFLTKPLHFDEVLASLQQHLGIEWIYRALSPADAEDDELETLPLIFPPQETLQDILKCVDFGNITGLQEMINRLKQQHPELKAFIIKIERLAGKFDFEKIADLLRSQMDGQT